MDTHEFWEKHRIFKVRLKEGNLDEARRSLFRMTQLYPVINDNDMMGNKAIIHDALALDKVIPNFKLNYFIPFAMKLADTDWAGSKRHGHIVPSLGQRITNRLMNDIGNRSNEYINGVMPFFRKALQHNPSNKDNLRHLAQLYARVKLKTNAIRIYKQLVSRYGDAYLYAELADLITTPNEKIALLCQAIVHQPKENFNMGYRYKLAELLQMPAPTRAAYEIGKSIEARKKAQLPTPADLERIQRILSAFTPVSEVEQMAFYKSTEPLANRIINEETVP